MTEPCRPSRHYDYIDVGASIYFDSFATIRREADLSRVPADAEKLASQLNEVTVTLKRRSGEHDQLFGSVTSSDVASQLEHKGFNIDRRKISLDEPIKTLGEHKVAIRLFKDVTAMLTLSKGNGCSLVIWPPLAPLPLGPGRCHSGKMRDPCLWWGFSPVMNSSQGPLRVMSCRLWKDSFVYSGQQNISSWTDHAIY